jgi:hypothetical protein
MFIRDKNCSLIRDKRGREDDKMGNQNFASLLFWRTASLHEWCELLETCSIIQHFQKYLRKILAIEIKSMMEMIVFQRILFNKVQLIKNLYYWNAAKYVIGPNLSNLSMVWNIISSSIFYKEKSYFGAFRLCLFYWNIRYIFKDTNTNIGNYLYVFGSLL